MGGLNRSPERRRRAVRLPFGLLLLLGVLAMHGFQASPSPNQMTGIALTTISGHHPSSSAAPAVHHSPGNEQPGDRHKDHPGGQVCLAMLTMISFLGAIVAPFARDPITVARRLMARVRILLVGRPPPRPSLHQLSVLRL